MKYSAYAHHETDVSELHKAGFSEVILATHSLSRLGLLDVERAQSLAKFAKELGLRPVLEWDVLMTAPSFQRALATLNKLDLSCFSALRVQDPGAFEFALKHIPQLALQLILETGNHNLAGVQRWVEYGKDRVERVILSLELPKARLAEYCKALELDVELAGLSPILLLYTPRHLLSYQKQDLSWTQDTDSDHTSYHLEALASCEENTHRGFRVHENIHDTFLFHAKDYCLLDRIDELDEIGVKLLRIDSRLDPKREQNWPLLSSFLKKPAKDEFENFKTAHSVAVTRCFFQANATDVLFKRLKNTDIQRRDQGYLGQIVEAEKSRHLIVNVLSEKLVLKPRQRLRFVTPEGKSLEHELLKLRDLEQNDVIEARKGDLAVLPYLKGVSVRTAVYVCE